MWFSLEGSLLATVVTVLLIQGLLAGALAPRVLRVAARLIERPPRRRAAVLLGLVVFVAIANLAIGTIASWWSTAILALVALLSTALLIDHQRARGLVLHLAGSVLLWLLVDSTN